MPVYVPLSLYAEHRRRFADHPDPRQRQLATFIGQHLMERQSGLNLPDDFFATPLDQGQNIILLLDGLDEVSNEDERALVAQAVRDLTYGREHARFVITSRTPAYQDRAVLGGSFRTIRVLPLESTHVADLIRRAYTAIYPAEVERDERERRASDLIVGVEKLEADQATRLGRNEEHRLVTTPLMVRMLLIAHFNLRRLPEQRAELYMEVVDALLTSSYNPDEVVAQRLAQLGGDWRTRRDMCQYLAFHMHSGGSGAGRDIGEREMSELLGVYLSKRRHKAVDVAQELVEDFVAASRQRGGLLEEQSGRYRFANLGFQEFLTARYLAESEREAKPIARFIQEKGRAENSWWREPFVLTIGYLSVSAPDVAADLVSLLARLDGPRQHNTASHLAAAELGSTAFLEWGGLSLLREKLANRLADLIADPHLDDATPVQRMQVGSTPSSTG